MTSLITDDLIALAAQVGEKLQNQRHSIACAESCTGGLVAAAFTSVAGSSTWFDRGYVTYSNQAKQELLGVRDDTLARFGAVSEETAMEMASGVLLSGTSASIALSTTGIAGPGGATPGKPVGMVCFGLAQRTADGVNVRALTQVFQGNRAQVREQSVRFALAQVLELG
jgi:nicotinamide-nucleotide amidase